MATADKTRQRLVDSMRKSKTGAASKPAEGGRAATATKAPARRAPAKPATRRQQPSTTAAVMMAVTWQDSEDPYQSDGRIWPD